MFNRHFLKEPDEEELERNRHAKFTSIELP